jgi:hypothetical protein
MGTVEAVLVRYYLELLQPAYAVEAVLSRDPQAWLPEVVHASNRWGMEMISKVGLNIGHRRIDREVSLSVSSPHQLGDTYVIPIAWAPTAEHSMLPSLEGDLEVSPLGDDRAQLAISASYSPPLGWLGALSDRALMRRVAEATIKDFLDHVALAVEANLQEESDASPRQVLRAPRPERPVVLATHGPDPVRQPPSM